MIAAMLARDVTIGMRTAAFAAALATHAALLAAFIVLWGGGVPTLPGANLYEQQRLVQTALLACLLPWAAARCGPGHRGDDMVLLSALAAARPSRIVRAQFAALFALLAAVGVSGLPLMLLAAQMAAVPLQTVLVDLLPVLGIAALAAAAAVVWTSGQADSLAAWLGATASSVLIVAALAIVVPRGTGTLGLFAIGLTGTAACASRADVSRRYLSECP